MPRSNIHVFNTPAELAIYNAMLEVEKLGPDVRLTEVTIKLQAAKEIVGTYVDEQLRNMGNATINEGGVMPRTPPQFRSDIIL